MQDSPERKNKKIEKRKNKKIEKTVDKFFYMSIITLVRSGVV